jgi:hypothetical protein
MADPMQKTGAIIAHEFTVMREQNALNVIVYLAQQTPGN